MQSRESSQCDGTALRSEESIPLLLEMSLLVVEGAKERMLDSSADLIARAQSQGSDWLADATIADAACLTAKTARSTCSTDLHCGNVARADSSTRLLAAGLPWMDVPLC